MSGNSISWKAVGLVASVFVLGIALGGVGVHGWDAHVQAQRGHRNIVKELKGELRLTPAQEKQFDAIIADEQSKFHAIDAQQHAEWSPKFRALAAQEHAEWDPKWDQVRHQGRDSIRAILTPAQRSQFDAFVKRLDEERRKHEGR
ncbi:MAG TPA: Spy/CpxP family protein refolding chaperone [Candidatus Limnocylindrales bacterium]|nr:Spy/CpxP family protein refolding chaperone [Candidatus Limnocylindrales bacterium]